MADTSFWCTVLSTEGHRSCGMNGCQCACHLRGAASSGFDQKRSAHRPHSYPRADWLARKPAGWHRERERQRREALWR